MALFIPVPCCSMVLGTTLQYLTIFVLVHIVCVICKLHSTCRYIWHSTNQDVAYDNVMLLVV